MIDIHAHILPGVDDGARDFEESVAVVRWLAHQGVTDVVATPHYIDETEYVSPRKANLKLLEELKDKLKENGVEVGVYLGNEIYINNEIGRLIEAGKISTLAESNYLLVELPLNGEFPNWEEYLRELVYNGYKVVLAHPERYEIVQENYDKVMDICAMGVLLQCNLKSVLGAYGKKAEKVVKRLAKDKMPFAFAGDTHRVGRKNYLTLAQNKLRKYYSEEELKRVLEANLRKIIG